MTACHPGGANEIVTPSLWGIGIGAVLGTAIAQAVADRGGRQVRLQMKYMNRALFAAGLTAQALAVMPAYADARIGVAAAVASKAEGIVNGKSSALVAGSELVTNETVRTGTNDTAQLLFLDQTSLSVGPKSEVTLDKFVYDPNRSKGDVVLQATKGAFRFVSGTQDPHSYALNTPVASIGVRGTIIDFLVQGDQLVVILVEGWSEITLPGGQIVRLTTPGTAIHISKDGTVQGPKAWDGTYRNIVQAASFPLYGHRFSSEKPDFDGGDSSHIDLTEETITHTIELYSPPNPCEDECGCGHGNIYGE